MEKTLEQARRFLERSALAHPCDLDLLVFFARHPQTLLASEQLAILMGYEATQIASSLNRLQRAGVLTVSENPAYVARKYVFSVGDQNAAWVQDLLQLASTRGGRLNLMRALKERSAGKTASPGTKAKRDAAPRPGSITRRKGKNR